MNIDQEQACSVSSTSSFDLLSQDASLKTECKKGYATVSYIVRIKLSDEQGLSFTISAHELLALEVLS